MKNKLSNFGKFLLRYLNVVINIDEINWDEVSDAYEEYLKNQIIEIRRKDTNISRPGLLYINWVISKYYDVDPWLVREGKSRKRELTKPRQVGHYIAVSVFKYTLQATGEFYHKNHSTILHSKKTVENEMEIDKKYKEEILNIIDIFKNGNKN